MQLNKEFLKRASTYANLISGVLASTMVFYPQFVPAEYTPYIMATGAVVIGVCQVITWRATTWNG